MNNLESFLDQIEEFKPKRGVKAKTFEEYEKENNFLIE